MAIPRKLMVEVIRAQELHPASCSGVFVELLFQGERQRTTTKEDTINPTWREHFSFDVPDQETFTDLSLEAHVYRVGGRTNSSRKFIVGKVRLEGARFVPLAEAVAESYTLQKQGWLFSREKGKLVLLVYLEINDPSSTGDHAADGSVTRNADAAGRQTTSTPEQQNRQAPRVPNLMVRHINPSLGGGRVTPHGRLHMVGGRSPQAARAPSSHQLVETMWYIFVSVVEGGNLPDMRSTGSLNPYVEVSYGNYKGRTRHFEGEQNPAWDAVFAFSDDYMESPEVEVVVKSRDTVSDDFVGMVLFNLTNVPTRVPPDDAVNPQWYRLMNERNEATSARLMLAVWKGTQADKAFHEAWHSDSATREHPSPISSQLRSKVYYPPVLWYLRLDIKRAEGFATAGNPLLTKVRVKAAIGSSVLKTSQVERRDSWILEETLFFVVAEPFDESLILHVYGCDAHSRNEGVIGRVVIPLTSVEKRTDHQEIRPRWFNLRKSDGNGIADVMVRPDETFNAKLLVGLSLEARYCVLDGPWQHSGDLRSTANQLCDSPVVGLLELGILNAEALVLREGRSTMNPYCVAKYGRKWVRTRTIMGSQNPRFNEQFAWDVYDPCTVLTIGVFHNEQIGSASSSSGTRTDRWVGKVGIRLSTLDAGRVYALAYPLAAIGTTSGVKKIGELHVAFRFSFTSLLSMSGVYWRPLLPEVHYTSPLSKPSDFVDAHLARMARSVIADKLCLMEPPLRSEVVHYICQISPDMYSMRRTKSLFHRFAAVTSPFAAAWQWFGNMAKWEEPCITLFCHVVFLAAVCWPFMLLPAVPSCLSLLLIWNRRRRPSHPEHVDASISALGDLHPDEIEEEFDTFPTGIRDHMLVRMRYDRLRHVAGRLQSTACDVVNVLERADTLLRWRDPRATAVFAFCCVAAAISLSFAPRLVAAAAGLYMMRHPKFRSTPSALESFFMRLPSKQDCVM